MAAIQRLARQALLTFRSRDAAAFPKNFDILKTMMDQITPSDINLPVPEKGTSKSEESKLFGAPVTHMSIFECQHFTLGVFILNRHGVTIPLHDHPGMSGLCKVMYGSLRIRSYDRWPSQDTTADVPVPEFKDSYGKSPILTQFNSDRIFTTDSGTCVLTQNVGNYHSVQANGGQAAFLDILAPPYSTVEGRNCTYFRELTVVKKNKDPVVEDESVRWLVQVPDPMDFYCDSLAYSGPSISLE